MAWRFPIGESAVYVVTYPGRHHVNHITLYPTDERRAAAFTLTDEELVDFADALRLIARGVRRRAKKPPVTPAE